jgi:hypothetical protein
MWLTSHNPIGLHGLLRGMALSQPQVWQHRLNVHSPQLNRSWTVRQWSWTLCTWNTLEPNRSLLVHIHFAFPPRQIQISTKLYSWLAVPPLETLVSPRTKRLVGEPLWRRPDVQFDSTELWLGWGSVRDCDCNKSRGGLYTSVLEEVLSPFIPVWDALFNILSAPHAHWRSLNHIANVTAKTRPCGVQQQFALVESVAVGLYNVKVSLQNGS